MKHFLLAAGLGLALCNSATAAEVSFDASATGLFDPSVELPTFDTSLGTLVSADLSFEAVFENTISFNTFCTDCDESITFFSEVIVQAFGDTLTFGSSSATFTCVTDGTEECFDEQIFTAIAAGTASLDVADILAAPIVQVFAFTPFVTATEAIPDFFDIFSTASLDAKITYTFDDGAMAPIPLPMSASLLLVGLGGLGIAARRRRM